MLAIVGVLWSAPPESQAEELIDRAFNAKGLGFFATSIIPDADTGDFSFVHGFLLVSSEDEGSVFFTLFRAEDSTGDDVDNAGNQLVLVLNVNGASQTLTFDFNLNDGFGFVSDELDLNAEDEVEVVQVRVQDPSGNTFGVPGLRIQD